jgi:hypothetical protein
MSPYEKQGDIDDERAAQIEAGDRLPSRESTGVESCAWSGGISLTGQGVIFPEQ